jgi:acyl carrier protein
VNSEVFEKVKMFTVKQSGVPARKVTGDSALENDLGISGDDAYDFIIAFGKEFDVDISKFKGADYFSPEGDSILPAIIRMFTGKKHPKQKELTIKHLEKAVIAGRLDEEVINS